MDQNLINYLKQPLLLVLFLSFIVEFFTSRTFDFLTPFILKKANPSIDRRIISIKNLLSWENIEQFRKKFAPYISLIWGEIFAFIFKIKFFHSLNLIGEEKLLVIDIILSGVILSKGSNFMYDFRKMFQLSKKFN